MILTEEELEHMKQLSGKNPNDKVLLSILNKMQDDTIESLIQKIIEIASKTHPGNPNEFIESSKYDGSNMVLFLTDFASGNIPLSEFDFNIIDIDCKSCDITKKEIENLRDQFIECVCKKNPTSPHVLVYKLSQTLTSETCDAIEHICKKHNTKLMMPVHSYDNNKYIYINVHISEILRSCSLSFHKLYSGNYRILNGFTGELICFDSD